MEETPVLMLTTKRKIELKPKPKQKTPTENKKKIQKKKQKQCENPLLRLIGHQDYWVGNGNGNGGFQPRSASLFFLFRFQVFSFVSRSARSLDGQTDGHADRRTTIYKQFCASRQIHFCLFVFQLGPPLLVGVKLAKRGPRHCERGPSTNQITLTHKLYVS